jgi:hypothetical protein
LPEPAATTAAAYTFHRNTFTEYYCSAGIYRYQPAKGQWILPSTRWGKFMTQTTSNTDGTNPPPGKTQNPTKPQVNRISLVVTGITWHFFDGSRLILRRMIRWKAWFYSERKVPVEQGLVAF